MSNRPKPTAKSRNPTKTQRDAAARAAAREAREDSERRFRAATGAEDPGLQGRLFMQAMRAVRVAPGENYDDAMLATMAAMEAVCPRDTVEGMLASQMVATHETAMECLRRACLPDQSFEGRDLNLKHAEKFMQIYARQLEALGKHRGRGQQKITVEHVTVQAGAHAIVGNVEAGRVRPPRRAPPQLEHQQDVPRPSFLSQTTDEQEPVEIRESPRVRRQSR